jgi:hypothetical protein
MAGSMILNITYGIDVQSIQDPYIQIAEQSMASMQEAMNANAFLVDTLPFRAF